MDDLWGLVAIVVVVIRKAKIEVGQDVQLPRGVIPLFPALFPTRIRGGCLRRGQRKATDASLIFQGLYLIPQLFPLRWISKGFRGRTWVRRTVCDALVLVREAGGDLKDLLSRGIWSHVKRSKEETCGNRSIKSG